MLRTELILFFRIQKFAKQLNGWSRVHKLDNSICGIVDCLAPEIDEKKRNKMEIKCFTVEELKMRDSKISSKASMDMFYEI